MAADAPRSRDDLAAWLALAEIPGVGPARLRALARAFGGAGAACAAPARAIAELPGFSPAAAAAVRAADPARGHAVLDALERLGAGVVLPGDACYPPLLAEVTDPPSYLFVWGDGDLLRRPAAAIVGSRDHTAYGAEVTRAFAAALARSGVVVVSGMARGLDAVAHTAALDAGGGSVGVLGCGFGVIYPRRNRALYDRMAAQGCLVTEYPPGERPFQGAFPRRNRIIAGMCRATLVVEAALTSGAINTADEALRQGRDVLAVPGPVTSPTSAGTNRLISQGAKPALAAGDLLEELGLPSEPAPLASRAPPADLTPVQRSLWRALAAEPSHVDRLVAAAGAPAGAVLTELTHLELRGVVVQRAGMVYELA